MEFFAWDEHYLTGMASIDEQHRNLIEIINELIRTIAHQKTASELNEVFSRLKAYAEHHFRDEEALMAREGIYADYYSDHCKQHLQYVNVLERETRSSLNNIANAQNLLTFLGQWLIFHILGSDHSMARQIRAIRSGAVAADAFHNEQMYREQSIDPLLRALHGMVGQMMERNTILVNLNETLEERVVERTEELRLANASLSELVHKLEHEMTESQRLSEELALANVLLKDMALTDALTGLPNRRYVMDRLSQLWSEFLRYGSSFSCIMIDADGFKQVNDTWGHDAGDRLLVELAHALRSEARLEDVVVRLGGDEFMILCPRTSLQDAIHIAQRVHHAVSQMCISVGDGQWSGSLSMGVAEVRDDFDKAENVVSFADKGLYLAKQRGRNQIATV